MTLRNIISILAVTCAITATAATSFNVGAYNIRVKNPNDPGEKAWDNRKDDLARLVRHADFDVVGFNEVKFGSQREELKNLLSEYSFVDWDGEDYNGNPVDNTSTDAIAFRTDKFDLLDSGFYFLGHDLNHWEICWDNSSYNNVRHAVWAKLTPKGVDEPFVVICSHLDHQGSMARYLQSIINLNQSWNLAGHLPVIVMGDMNSTTTRVNYYRLYLANFDDAFAKAPEKDVPYEATSGQWNDDVTAGNRIDWIWTRGFKINKYSHITEKFDRQWACSDHLPVIANVTYDCPDLARTHIYVDLEGSAGDGSKIAPYNDLATALKNAQRGDSIYVTEGAIFVTKALEPAKSVHIFGGYNKDFTEVTGLTEVTSDGAHRGFYLPSNTDTEICNFRILATGNEADGGAIKAVGSRVILRDCVFEHCSAGNNGGAVYTTGQLTLDRCAFIGNKAANQGGGFWCDAPNKRYWHNFPITNCYFEGNEAKDGAAGYLPRFLDAWIANCTFTENVATDGSVVYLYAHRDGNTLNPRLSVFNNTFTNNTCAGVGHASAIYVDIESNAPAAVANNTILGNHAPEGATACHLACCEPYLWNNIIACNDGGDVLIDMEGFSASYNLYTSKETLNYSPVSRDFYTQSYAETAASLTKLIDGEIVEGKLVPRLTLADDLASAHTLTTSEGRVVMAAGVVPTVALIGHKMGERSICCIPANRLAESYLHVDVDFDSDWLGSMTHDALGIERHNDGTATIGALEFTGDTAVPIISVDAAEAEASHADGPFFDLLGRRVADGRHHGLMVGRRGLFLMK